MDQEGKIIQAVVTELTTKLGDLEGIYLFGSRNTGESTDTSDWDFAYLSRIGLDAGTSWEIQSTIGSKFNLDIDLVDLYKANTILQVQVLKTGKLVWSGKEAEVKQFEYLTLSYYQKLNEERAEILKDVKFRGSIYG